MQRFNNILLAAGGKGWEENSLKRAVSLARNNGARLMVVDVIEELPQDLRRLAAAVPLEALQKRTVADRREQLEKSIAPYKRSGLPVGVKVLVGKEYLEIIREVLRSRHDLIIKTAESSARLKTMAFGSTAMNLMRKCPCPVWILKPAVRRNYARVMAAVDPDPSNRAAEALNAKIMELATSLAQREGSELHVVHAWKLHGERMLTIHAGLQYSEVEKFARIVRAQHAGRLAELVEAFAPDTPADRVHLLKGDPGALISALAKRKEIELLVMGTLSRTGIAGVFIGNTAEKVLHQVDCSVLTVKPDGFVTPVKHS